MYVAIHPVESLHNLHVSGITPWIARSSVIYMERSKKAGLSLNDHDIHAHMN